MTKGMNQGCLEEGKGAGKKEWGKEGKKEWKRRNEER